ncbi:MAG: hypothetical protein BM560_01005 [Roseobacter sp. MedPE-SWde]|nr:MAG: hypothetical protein BM560_01005 [Roseobacter sp. MedPE-SWde]
MQITMDKAPMQAGILCNDVAFQNYAAARNGFAKGEFDPSKSAEHIRQICKIDSRRELLNNTAAFDRFQKLHTDFLLWSGRIQAPQR